MKNDPICFSEGKYIRQSTLHVAPNDLGILRGYGIFDFLRTYGGKPFLMDEHLARFERSAKRMGLKIPYSRAALKRISLELIKRNSFKDVNIKYILTGGPSANGITIGTKPTFYAITSDAINYPPAYYEHGVRMETHEYLRLVPEAKTLNYIVSLRNQKRLKQKGVMELIYVYGGKVLEASSANIFVVKRGVLHTPKKDVLIGTVRNFILEEAKGVFKAVERDVTVRELMNADEVFATASNKGVMPVTVIDGKKIGSGKPGPVTKVLMDYYDECVAAL